MSQIFTVVEDKICEICNSVMISLQVGRYKCLTCGAKEDNY